MAAARQRRGEEPHARRETAEQHRQRAEAPEISDCFLDAVRGAERDAAVQRQDTGASQGASRIRNVIASKEPAALAATSQTRCCTSVASVGDEQQEAARKRQAGPLD